MHLTMRKQLVDAAGPAHGSVEIRMHHGPRAELRPPIELARAEGHAMLAVATAPADIGNLRFYQRLGFRMREIERDAFTEATGYPPQDVDGIPLRDRGWLDLDLRVTDRAGS